MSKRVKAIVRLTIGAGQAKPAPPVGPALGQAGVNIMGFCKEFNAKTANIEDNVPIPVTLTAFEDRSFAFETRTPPATFFIKRAAGVEKGLSKPGKEKLAGKEQPQISLRALYEIAVVKADDEMNVDVPMQGIMKSLMGTCRSMGIKVVP
mmetsp:Transcript_11149/g.40879  ORF Transcript_11149/g.40879 Transcript_11149/m.40879 type:complete len:150 (-) Transcript_11149:1188-1637(-)